MANKLQQYFPMIRTQNEILEKIKNDPALFDTFRQWEPEQQQEFLDFCSGAKGVKMLYDGFSKSILNPNVFPERLNELLLMILANLGQSSYNSRTTFLKYTDRVPETSGQKLCPRGTS